MVRKISISEKIRIDMGGGVHALTHLHYIWISTEKNGSKCPIYPLEVSKFLSKFVLYGTVSIIES